MCSPGCVNTPYGGYPTWMLALFGWGAAAAAMLVGYLLAPMRWREGIELDPDVVCADADSHSTDSKRGVER